MPRSSCEERGVYRELETELASQCEAEMNEDRD